MGKACDTARYLKDDLIVTPLLHLPDHSLDRTRPHPCRTLVAMYIFDNIKRIPLRHVSELSNYE